jgi:5-methylcytosine-specific restriction endonuclease McrA
VCAKFVQELGKTCPHSIVYRGHSFAGCGQMVMDSLCVADPRQQPTYLEIQAVLARCGGKCEICNDPVAEIDHHVPRSCFGRDDLGNYVGLCYACHKLKMSSCDANRIFT